MTTSPIISKVWSFCTTLRDDGVSYGDYLEQLTYLIFLKMADEYGKPPYNCDVGIPAEFNWQSLKSKRGAELEGHYVTLLRELGKKRGMPGEGKINHREHRGHRGEKRLSQSSRRTLRKGRSSIRKPIHRGGKGAGGGHEE